MRLLERGVYRAQYLSATGDVVLFAVNHAHRLIDNGIVYLHEDDDFLGPIAALWRMLDAQDPEYARRQVPREEPKAPRPTALLAGMAVLPIATTFALLRLLML